MSGNNEFFRKRDERDRKFFWAGFMMGCQLVHDFIQMGLRDKKAVGKDIFGRGRIDKLFDVCREYDDYFHICFTKHVEADKRQEEMDGRLREIYKDDLVPFQERYPYAKFYGYMKPLKEWVE